MDQIASAEGIPIRDLGQIIRRILFEAQGMFAERVEGVVQIVRKHDNKRSRIGVQIIIGNANLFGRFRLIA